MDNQNKELLLRIKDLKQYFPLKKKGMFVKANDGISLDIYREETFGLVGESGCGKSTLGRVLLQLYHQTDGKTMYYGRTLDSMAPAYVEETLKNLNRHRTEMEACREKLEEARAALSKALGTEVTLDQTKVEIPEEREDAKELFDKLSEFNQAKKAANDAFLDIVQLIGGFIVAEDLEPVSKAFLDVYYLAKANKKLHEELSAFELDEADLLFAIDEKQKKNRSAGGMQKKVAALREKISAKSREIEEKEKELRAAHEVIDRMRESYKDNAAFQENETFLDDGIDLARLEYSEMRLLRRDLQLIFQDPYSSLNPKMTVGQIIGEGLIAHGVFKRNDARMQQFVIQVMEECGLQPYMLHRYPHQFSGGQRQRIGIARSLALRPKFVVCDEAVSALDVSIQSQILNLLLDLKEKDNLTYLFISHDLSVVKYISDRIGVMYLGTLVEIAPSEALFANPKHPYTEALLNAIPTTDLDRSKEISLLEGDIPSPINPPKGCKFHTRCKYCTKICTEVTPEFEEVEPGHLVACHHQLGSR